MRLRERESHLRQGYSAAGTRGVLLGPEGVGGELQHTNTTCNMQENVPKWERSTRKMGLRGTESAWTHSALVGIGLSANWPEWEQA